MAVGGKISFEVDDGTFIGQREHCKMCKQREHDGYCSQCEIYVCQICFDLHLNSKVCRDHVLLQDADQSNIQDSGVCFETCSAHKHQEVRLFCTEHKCCGCSECILLHHSSCKWDYIVEASNRFQNSGDLARLLEDVQSLEYTLDKYMEAIDKHTKTAETINKDVVSDIETFAKSLVKYVAGSKQQALDDAKVREVTHQQKLDKLKVDIQFLGSQVEEIITDFRNEEMLHKRFILAVETMPKVARLQSKIAAIDCDKVITNYTFRPGNFLKSMMSNTRPIGRLTDASQTEDDGEDITVKRERERSIGLEQQLKENQKMLSEHKKVIHEMVETYEHVVSKQNIELQIVMQKYDSAVKDKQSLEQRIGVQNSSNQGTISKLKQELDDIKLKYGTIVKEKQAIEQELSTIKHKHEPSVILPCGHENLAIQLRVVDRLIKCRTCGIITGDQPNGTFTANNDCEYIQLNFTFPNGTQSKFNRNPGQPYSGTKVVCYLLNDREGTIIMKMMNVVFKRKCLFTVDNQGTIQNRVELFTDSTCLWQRRSYASILQTPSQKYPEYIVRVRQQLLERGIKESDVTH